MYTLTELGEVLHEEHFRILVPICGLENRIAGGRASEPLDPRNEDDRNLLDDLVSSLEQVIQHNVFEETVLFPLLCDQGEKELAELLVQEHVVIGPLARRLSGLAAELLALGTSPARWNAFRDVAQDLISEMLLHLQKEELSVVQRLDAFLDTETDHRLARELAAARAVSDYKPPAPGYPGQSGGEARRFDAAVVVGRTRLVPLNVPERDAAAGTVRARPSPWFRSCG